MTPARNIEFAQSGRPAAASPLATPAARAAVALALVLAVGVIFNADGAFFRLGTHRDTLRQASVFGILACGMTVVVISGGIDLSAGSVLALVAVCFSILTIWRQWPPIAAVTLSLALGAACGAISGTLVARLRLQPFIATRWP